MLNICWIFVEYLLNFKSNCWHFADSNFISNPKIFAISLMISWQSYCFIIFLTTNSQKNEHFAIFICISKLEKFLYGQVMTFMSLNLPNIFWLISWFSGSGIPPNVIQIRASFEFCIKKIFGYVHWKGCPVQNWPKTNICI